MDRRNLIKSLALSTGALSLNSFSMPSESVLKWQGKRILFQGDSITDFGRNREISGPNHSSALGGGYALQVAGQLLRKEPHFELEIYNRGISGNKVFQLSERWEEDALNLTPDLLSILIGVNDYWHSRNQDYDGTVGIYENDFRQLLNTTFDKLPNASIIIGEPFIVRGGTAISEDWYPEFKLYQEVAFKLAKEFNTGFIPYQAYFDKALEEAPVSYWCPDGVHPSIAGTVLMAEAWLETFKRM